MIGSFTEKTNTNFSIVKLYNSFDQNIKPERRLSYTSDLFSSSPLSLPQEHHSWFWKTKTPITSERVRLSFVTRILLRNNLSEF